MADKTQPIIIKRKGGHAGHHGGAWKVAYADFVTAMMALFIVLWLMNTSKPVQEAISGYFKDPAGNGKLTGSNIPKTQPGQPSKEVTKENLNQVKAELEKAIQQMANFDKFKDHIQLTVTAEGLRIELLESKKDTFFETGRPEPNADGQQLMATIAEELGKVPNKVLIEGHTDSQPYAGAANYTNWDLSADRANASRRIMQQHGLRADQVGQVRGFADQQLRNVKDPFDPANRRITLIVQYLEQKSPADAAPGATQESRSTNAAGTAKESASPSSSSSAEKKH
jgi:chemotaxis protein MotB